MGGAVPEDGFGDTDLDDEARFVNLVPTDLAGDHQVVFHPGPEFGDEFSLVIGGHASKWVGSNVTAAIGCLESCCQRSLWRRSCRARILRRT